MGLSWIFEFGCCFCGCNDKNEFDKNDPFFSRPSPRIIDKQVTSSKLFSTKWSSNKEHEALISSTSCSGYQSYLACTESSDADDERSVDVRQNLRTSKLNAVTEEEPRVRNLLGENDQVRDDDNGSIVTTDHLTGRRRLAGRVDSVIGLRREFAPSLRDSGQLSPFARCVPVD